MVTKSPQTKQPKKRNDMTPTEITSLTKLRSLAVRQKENAEVQIAEIDKLLDGKKPKRKPMNFETSPDYLKFRARMTKTV